MCAKNRHQCECGSFSMVPVRGFGLALDTSGIACELPVAPEALYVNAVTGEDDNDGLSPDTALKTINAAVELFQSYLYAHKSFTIYLAPGVYREDVTIDKPGPQHLSLKGDSTEYPVIIGDVKVNHSAYAQFSYLHFQGRSQGVAAYAGAVIDISECKLTTTGPGQGGALLAHAQGFVNINGALDVDCTAGCMSVLKSAEGTLRVINDVIVSINGNVSTGVCLALWGGAVSSPMIGHVSREQ